VKKECKKCGGKAHKNLRLHVGRFIPTILFSDILSFVASEQQATVLYAVLSSVCCIKINKRHIMSTDINSYKCYENQFLSTVNYILFTCGLFSILLTSIAQSIS
jgi:hypothetical protein